MRTSQSTQTLLRLTQKKSSVKKMLSSPRKPPREYRKVIQFVEFL